MEQTSEEVLTYLPDLERYQRAAERAAAGHWREAIRLKCLECCGGTYSEVRKCEVRTCALWTARLRSLGERVSASQGRSGGRTDEGDEI